jgi:hypothetical protein
MPRQGISIYKYYPHLVVSIDFIKSDRNRFAFINDAPDLICRWRRRVQVVVEELAAGRSGFPEPVAQPVVVLVPRLAEALEAWPPAPPELLYQAFGLVSAPDLRPPLKRLQVRSP